MCLCIHLLLCLGYQSDICLVEKRCFSCFLVKILVLSSTFERFCASCWESFKGEGTVTCYDQKIFEGVLVLVFQHLCSFPLTLSAELIMVLNSCRVILWGQLVLIWSCRNLKRRGIKAMEKWAQSKRCCWPKWYGVHNTYEPGKMF